MAMQIDFRIFNGYAMQNYEWEQKLYLEQLKWEILKEEFFMGIQIAFAVICIMMFDDWAMKCIKRVNFLNVTYYKIPKMQGNKRIRRYQRNKRQRLRERNEEISDQTLFGVKRIIELAKLSQGTQTESPILISESITVINNRQSKKILKEIETQTDDQNQEEIIWSNEVEISQAWGNDAKNYTKYGICNECLSPKECIKCNNDKVEALEKEEKSGRFVERENSLDHKRCKQCNIIDMCNEKGICIGYCEKRDFNNEIFEEEFRKLIIVRDIGSKLSPQLEGEFKLLIASMRALKDKKIYSKERFVQRVKERYEMFISNRNFVKENNCYFRRKKY